MVTTCFSEWVPSKNRSFFITFGMAWMIVGWVMAALVGTVMVQVARALVLRHPARCR